MAKWVKILTTSLVICFTATLMVVGIFAATSSSFSTNASVSWTVQEISVAINGKVYGNKSTDNIVGDYSTVLNVGDFNEEKNWEIGTINFDIIDNTITNKRECVAIVFRISLTNLAINSINYIFDEAPTLIENVNYEYQLAYGKLTGDEDWETDFFSPSYSGDMTVTSASNVKDDYERCILYEQAGRYLEKDDTAVFEIRMKIGNLTKNVPNVNFDMSIVANNQTT